MAGYLRDIQLATPKDGEMAVENLAIGDLVATLDGPMPIKWIGRRSYLGHFTRGNKAVLPVCISAGALADGVPCRDLWVSPKHALLLDGTLIPAGVLVNGTSIVQAREVEAMEYFHIELDRHGILIAEGVLAESFVDDNCRGIFHNAHEHAALYPRCVPGACAVLRPAPKGWRASRGCPPLPRAACRPCCPVWLPEIRCATRLCGSDRGYARLWLGTEHGAARGAGLP